MYIKIIKEVFMIRLKSVMRYIKVNLKNEEGLGTVELVLIIAVLVGLALMFKGTIVEFVKSVLGDISGQQESFKIDNISNGN